jgi:ketosteroid isomerase-like protein
MALLIIRPRLSKYSGVCPVCAAGPQEVFERLVQGISTGQWQELHLLYAEQAVIDYPFAVPRLRLEGRDAIQRYFATAARMPLDLRAENIVIHQTGDPEVIIGEYDYDAHVTTTGRRFHVSNIQVSRIRDGQIVSSRDYHNHVAMAQASGRLASLLAALTDEQST